MVTDYVKRVRLRIENGEKVMIDFRSASVTHPISSVSGRSKSGMQAVLGHKYGYLQKSSKRLDLTCKGDLYFLRAKTENEQVRDCALVMRDDEEVPMRQDRDEEGDVEEPPEDAGVENDEGEDSVGTEMRGPDEPTNAMRKHHQSTHIPFQTWCEQCVRGRAPDPSASKVGRESSRRDGHSNRLLLHENEATRWPHHDTGWCR